MRKVYVVEVTPSDDRYDVQVYVTDQSHYQQSLVTIQPRTLLHGEAAMELIAAAIGHHAGII